MPVTTEASLIQCTSGCRARQAHGDMIATMNTKNASPSTATGMRLNTSDCGLVVTFVQLIDAFSGQAANADWVKCSMVRYVASARPSTESTRVVNGRPPPAQSISRRQADRGARSLRAAAL